MLNRLALVLVSVGALRVTGETVGRARERAVGPEAVGVAGDTLPSLASFLIGSWKCSGGTPAGRLLNSEVTFAAALGGRFVESAHRDQPPGQYESIGMWPVAAEANALVTVVYDNFGGHRRFTASPWSTDSIVWTRDVNEPGARFETFTYRRVSRDRYWYAWHVRRDATSPPVLGDSATCQRVAAR